MNEHDTENTETKVRWYKRFGAWISSHIPETVKTTYANSGRVRWSLRVVGVGLTIVLVVLLLAYVNSADQHDQQPTAGSESVASTVTMDADEFEALVNKRVEAQIAERVKAEIAIERQVLQAQFDKAVADLPQVVNMSPATVKAMIDNAVREPVDGSFADLLAKIEDREVNRQAGANEVIAAIRENTKATEAQTLRDLRHEYLMRGNKYTGLPVTMAVTADVTP